ncbi:MAG: NlpC/P60 family protein [Rhizobiaceae bacterium]
MTALRDRIVAEARSWIGTPYRHQASRKGVGCDCLGLVRGVYRAIVGVEPEPPPPYAPDWAEAEGGDRLMRAAERCLVRPPEDRILPGDVLLFRWRADLAAKHCAILSAPNRFVHAYERSAVVETILVPQWRRRIAGVFSFPDSSEA